MEFTVTKEQILEFANWGNPDNKKKLKEWFPKAFESQLEVGTWYKFKFNAGLELMSMITEIQADRIYWFGFRDNIWRDSDWSELSSINQMSLFTEATPEEVESALIAEAKKRGYVGKEIVLIKGAIGSHSDVKMQENFSFEAFKNRLMCHCETYGSFTIFQDGKWAEILPEQKTIITKGKALRIIAKKLKVSPESIEIQ